MSRDVLEFVGVPDSVAHVFAQAVCDTLSQLGLEYDYDEVSPADAAGMVGIRVVGIKVAS